MTTRERIAKGLVDLEEFQEQVRQSALAIERQKQFKNWRDGGYSGTSEIIKAARKCYGWDK